MTVLTETFTLANGNLIPKIGFGTWQIPNGAPAYDSVAAALAAGYRHIDTARAYGNEASVAEAIRDSGIPREQIYLTTKLPAEVKTYQGAIDSFEVTMDALAEQYVDLYLIHAPWPWGQRGTDHSAGNAEAWRAMEEILDTGRAKAIGVSNFSVSDLEKLASSARETPQVNQIRWFIGHTQDDVVAYGKQHGILDRGVLAARDRRAHRQCRPAGDRRQVRQDGRAGRDPLRPAEAHAAAAEDHHAEPHRGER